METDAERITRETVEHDIEAGAERKRHPWRKKELVIMQRAAEKLRDKEGYSDPLSERAYKFDADRTMREEFERRLS